MNHIFNNLTNSLSEEFKKFDLDEVVNLSLSKLADYDLQINNLVKYNKSEFFKELLENIDADIVWVSLGFPKQEIFINNLCNELETSTNFIGIGAVFEWVAGEKKKAPEWVANLGLEWTLRLAQDPKRLYKRYLIDNTLFILYFLRQVFFRR